MILQLAVITSFQPEISENMQALHVRSQEDGFNWKDMTYQASFKFEGGQFIGESMLLSLLFG